MNRLLSTKELAEYYGYTTTTIHNWVRRGMPVEDKGGSSNRYNLDDVKQWRKEQQANKEDNK